MHTPQIRQEAKTQGILAMRRKKTVKTLSVQVRREQWLKKKATRVSEINASKIKDLECKCDSLISELKSERAKTKMEALKDYADEVRSLQFKRRDTKESIDKLMEKSVTAYTHSPMYGMP